MFTFLACEGKGPPDPNPGRHAESYGRAIAEETVVIARDHLLTHPDHPRQRQAREQLLRFQDLVEPEPSDQR